MADVLTEEQRARKRRQYDFFSEFITAKESGGGGFGIKPQPEQYQTLLSMNRDLTTSGAIDYDKDTMTRLAEKGGVNIPPPTSMPLAPELTRSADRQSAARRRRRGRSSTMLTSTLGEETLGG